MVDPVCEEGEDVSEVCPAVGTWTRPRELGTKTISKVSTVVGSVIAVVVVGAAHPGATNAGVDDFYLVFAHVSSLTVWDCLTEACLCDT